MIHFKAEAIAMPMVPVPDLAPAVIGAFLQRQPLSAAKVAFAWRTAVGPAMARASAARLDADGRLIVEVGDRRWLDAVRRATPMIRPRIDTLLGPGIVAALDVRAPSGGPRSARR